MKKSLSFRSFCAIAFIIAVGFGLSACKTATDTAVEKAAEQATGGEVDVDTSENRVAINVNGSSWEAGDSVKLPTNFPSDIYVAEGTLKVAIATNQEQGFSVSLESSDTVPNVKALYQRELVNDGWKLTGGMDINDTASVLATKENRSLSVTMGPNTEKTRTVVTITTFAETAAATAE